MLEAENIRLINASASIVYFELQLKNMFESKFSSQLFFKMNLTLDIFIAKT
jgi:hypothetical protein